MAGYQDYLNRFIEANKDIPNVIGRITAPIRKLTDPVASAIGTPISAGINYSRMVTDPVATATGDTIKAVASEVMPSYTTTPSVTPPATNTTSGWLNEQARGIGDNAIQSIPTNVPKMPDYAKRLASETPGTVTMTPVKKSGPYIPNEAPNITGVVGAQTTSLGAPISPNVSTPPPVVTAAKPTSSVPSKMGGVVYDPAAVKAYKDFQSRGKITGLMPKTGEKIGYTPTKSTQEKMLDREYQDKVRNAQNQAEVQRAAVEHKNKLDQINATQKGAERLAEMKGESEKEIAKMKLDKQGEMKMQEYIQKGLDREQASNLAKAEQAFRERLQKASDEAAQKRKETEVAGSVKQAEIAAGRNQTMTPAQKVTARRNLIATLAKLDEDANPDAYAAALNELTDLGTNVDQKAAKAPVFKTGDIREKDGVKYQRDENGKWNKIG